MIQVKKHKSSIANLDANIVALISYVGASGLGFVGGFRYVAWLVPFVIYLLEKKSKFVKKNAIQSLTLNISITIIYIILGIISSFVKPRWVVDNSYWLGGRYVGSWGAWNAINSITIIIGVAILVISIIAIIKAWNFEEYDIPVVSKYTDKIKNLLDKISKNEVEEAVEEKEETVKEEQ